MSIEFRKNMQNRNDEPPSACRNTRFARGARGGICRELKLLNRLWIEVELLTFASNHIDCGSM